MEAVGHHFDLLVRECLPWALSYKVYFARHGMDYQPWDPPVVVRVVRTEGDVVKLGIEAPADVPIFRQEIYQEIQQNNREARTSPRQAVPKLPRLESRRAGTGDTRLTAQG